METHFGDRLVDAIHKKGVPACVGLDPLIERFPADLLREHGIATTEEGHVEPGTPGEKITDAMVDFGQTVMRAIAPHVPAVKLNIAFFERYHVNGIRAYGELIRYAREQGLIVIGDVKRADIGHSTVQYAHAQLGEVEPWRGTGILNADAVTVNPYFGYDAIRPFVEIARRTGRGLFVLVQTSNESASEIQDLRLQDGSRVCEQVARLVQTWSADEDLVGESGYSCIGAVVSPRDTESTARLRALMPNCLFLVPGFGTQGKTIEQVRQCFKPDGTGALVTTSRTVIYAYRSPQRHEPLGADWKACVEQACAAFAQTVRKLGSS